MNFSMGDLVKTLGWVLFFAGWITWLMAAVLGRLPAHRGGAGLLKALYLGFFALDMFTPRARRIALSGFAASAAGIALIWIAN